MCSHPSLAINFGIDPVTGKNKVKLIPPRFDYSFADMLAKYGDDLLLLPCGSCDECVIKRKKDWATRCYCESLYHKENCFLTLTYDDEHLPQKLVKSHVQKFIKELRNNGVSCRYYACGEYGGQTARPHYHVVLFGYFPEDIKFLSKTKTGFNQYVSNFLDAIWRKGFVTVSEFSPSVAGYVAGYVSKKYKVADCFSLMSNRPGLGYCYVIDHLEEMYLHDNIILPGGVVAPIPRYFDKVASEQLGFELTKLKIRRNQRAQQSMFAEMRLYHCINLEQLQKVKVNLMAERTRFQKRGL